MSGVIRVGKLCTIFTVAGFMMVIGAEHFSYSCLTVFYIGQLVIDSVAASAPAIHGFSWEYNKFCKVINQFHIKYLMFHFQKVY